MGAYCEYSIEMMLKEVAVAYFNVLL